MKESLFEITKEMNKSGHSFGGKTPQQGFDCFGLIYYLSSKLEKNMESFEEPVVYEGQIITKDNYHETLKNFPREVRIQLLFDFIKKILKKVNSLELGDVLFLEWNKMKFVGVYLGQENIGLVFLEKGFKILKIKKVTLLEIYR